jgi:hypothetical protein
LFLTAPYRRRIPLLRTLVSVVWRQALLQVPFSLIEGHPQNHLARKGRAPSSKSQLQSLFENILLAASTG